MIKLPPDDAYALRMALEPLTHKITESEGSEIALASIAISLKRIADMMPKVQPTVTFTGDGLGDMVVQHPAWDHALKVVRGVVLIDVGDLRAAENHGWLQQPRATTKTESERGLIRVMKL